MKILITGGAGFIGSAVVKLALARNHAVINVDALTYAACLENLSSVSDNPLYHFEEADICDQAVLSDILAFHEPDAVMNLAAETHVDRSIDGPEKFIETNVVGTLRLLEATRLYWLTKNRSDIFRFHHVSTDEVYGSLGPEGKFSELTAYDPRSPYSASKASSDHLVRAWGETFGIPVLVTNCSNNYGPFQFPEKLIPVVVLNALAGKQIPIYGTGSNIRDWLYVDDHADALLTVLENGTVGRTYNIGGDCEFSNLDIVHKICELLDSYHPEGAPHSRLIGFVTDRPGHDRRYSIDMTRIRNELSWRPRTSLDDGLDQTIRWYLENRSWWESLLKRSGVGERLGTTR